MKKGHYRLSFGVLLFTGILISYRTKMLCLTIYFVECLHSLEAVQVQLVYGERDTFSLQEVLPRQRANSKTTARAEGLSVTELN